VAREDGFTLTELLVVIVIIGILTAIAIGFYSGAREKASDVTAKSNIRVAVPAIEAYRSDNSTYVGMTLPVLQASYSPGVQGIEVVSAGASAYDDNETRRPPSVHGSPGLPAARPGTADGERLCGPLSRRPPSVHGPFNRERVHHSQRRDHHVPFDHRADPPRRVGSR